MLAHELGHWKFSHNLKNICIAEVKLHVSNRQLFNVLRSSCVLQIDILFPGP